jgi:C4-dicarboxylate-specific signal transduction histidine kinase
MKISARTTVLEQMHFELHELCQPLTALQCQLEIGRMLGHETALKEAVEGALKETRRMFKVVARMRQRLLSEETTQK